jgi:hypothetical protein
MKASFESVKFSVRRCRCGRGGHGRHAGRFTRRWWRRSPASVLHPHDQDLGELLSSSWGLTMRYQRPRKIHSLPTLMTVRQLCGRRFQGALPSPPQHPFIHPPTLCQIRKRIRSSHCRPHKVPLYGVSDIFCEFFERFANRFYLIQSAAVGYRFSSRPLPFSAYFLFSHSCMSLL